MGVFSSTSPEVQQYFQLFNTIGRAGLHALFPEDFEFYMVSFELVDFDGKVVDFLIFPIMPDVLSDSETNIVNVKKTAGGITTLNTATFIPRSVHLAGNFGRRFKFLIGRNAGVDATAVRFSPNIKNFSNQIKTGYGTTKVLEKILDLSKKVDSKGRPFRLHFYNLAFGKSYVVKVMSQDFKQAFPDSNMIWNYEINLMAIAPLAGIKRDLKTSLLKLLGKGIVTQGINITFKAVKDSLKGVL